jgi:hypothetical protein
MTDVAHIFGLLFPWFKLHFGSRMGWNILGDFFAQIHLVTLHFLAVEGAYTS